jgi:hypothetical protein
MYLWDVKIPSTSDPVGHAPVIPAVQTVPSPGAETENKAGGKRALSDKRWYVIICGKEVGVFQTWYAHYASGRKYSLNPMYRARAGPLVIGVSGSIFHKVKNPEIGNLLFAEAVKDRKVKLLGARTSR